MVLQKVQFQVYVPKISLWSRDQLVRFFLCRSGEPGALDPGGGGGRSESAPFLEGSSAIMGGEVEEPTTPRWVAPPIRYCTFLQLRVKIGRRFGVKTRNKRQSRSKLEAQKRKFNIVNCLILT
jgi:hypothetical protein